MRACSITGFGVRVRTASRLMLHKSVGTRSSVAPRVQDAYGLEMSAGSHHGSEPQVLELTPGTYRISSCTVGGTVVSVELGYDDVMRDLA